MSGRPAAARERPRMLRVQPGSALPSADTYDSDELADSWRCAVVRNLAEAGEAAGEPEDVANDAPLDSNSGGSSGSSSSDGGDDDDVGITPVQPIITRAQRKSTPRYFDVEASNSTVFCPPPAGVHSNVCFLCGGRDHASYTCPVEICMVVRPDGLNPPSTHPALLSTATPDLTLTTCLRHCTGLPGAWPPHTRLPNSGQDHSLQLLRSSGPSAFGLSREADGNATGPLFVPLCGLRRLWALGLSVDVGQSSAAGQLPQLRRSPQGRRLHRRWYGPLAPHVCCRPCRELGGLEQWWRDKQPEGSTSRQRTRQGPWWRAWGARRRPWARREFERLEIDAGRRGRAGGRHGAGASAPAARLAASAPSTAWPRAWWQT